VHQTPPGYPRSDLLRDPLYAIDLPAGPLNGGNVSPHPGLLVPHTTGGIP